jgi:hypothetical protein
MDCFIGILLDIELSNEDFDRIATVFHQSGLNIMEIKEIDLFEVFPILQTNLLSFAGVWAGFNEDTLIPECIKHFNKRRNSFYRLNCRFWNLIFYWMRKDYWHAIEKRMTYA